jgi:hypothetical protein
MQIRDKHLGSGSDLFLYPGSGSDRLLSRIPDQDPTKREGENKLTFFMQESVIIFLIFAIFKGEILKIYRFD